MTSRPDIHPAIANLSPDRLARGLYWEKSWNVVTGCSHVSPGCDIPADFRADRQDWPDDSRSYRVGKRAAGRLLDGRTHDAFPEAGI